MVDRYVGTNAGSGQTISPSTSTYLSSTGLPYVLKGFRIFVGSASRTLTVTVDGVTRFGPTLMASGSIDITFNAPETITGSRAALIVMSWTGGTQNSNANSFTPGYYIADVIIQTASPEIGGNWVQSVLWLVDSGPTTFTAGQLPSDADQQGVPHSSPGVFPAEYRDRLVLPSSGRMFPWDNPPTRPRSSTP